MRTCQLQRSRDRAVAALKRTMPETLYDYHVRRIEAKFAHTADHLDYHGKYLGDCFDCETHLKQTGRYTTYCPSCQACEECGCPNADGFRHYPGCTIAAEEEAALEELEEEEEALV